MLPCSLVAIDHSHFPDDSIVYNNCCGNVRSCTELFSVDVLLHWSKELDCSCWVQDLACVMNRQDFCRKIAPGIELWYRLCGSWHSKEQLMSWQGYFTFMVSFISFFSWMLLHFSSVSGCSDATVFYYQQWCDWHQWL
jgi:hypothetical protein